MTRHRDLHTRARRRLFAGADAELVENDIIERLRARGLKEREATRAADDIVREECALRDGFAGGGVEPESWR